MSVRGDDETLVGTLPGIASEPVLAELVASRYRIIRWIGGGGMGRVYEALDTELDEHVALKVLRSGLSEEAIERFRREVKLTRRIQHRNVARMFDLGAHGDERFLTMELVAGGSLASLVGVPMAWPALRAIAAQLCAGLAAAHAAGIVHRDLKPDNILIEPGSAQVTDPGDPAWTGRVVITDFGIARGAEDASVTQVGSVVGTPRYMAPEQLMGSDLDARADLFALGVMLFELATGLRPWDGDNAVAIAVAQATQPMRRLAGAAVPEEAARVIEQCLEIDPAKRPSRAADVGAALASAKLEALPQPSPASPAGRVHVPSVPPPLDASPTTIAVLPVTTAPGDEHLGEVLLDELTDTLSTTPGLRVRPAGAARSLGDRDPREIGRELVVDHVVVATVRRHSDGLALAARLVNVLDGFQIWASKVECSERELLAAAVSLGRGIAEALSKHAAQTTRATDPRAVDLYLRARAELRRFWGTHAKAAAELLDEAVKLAPSSPPIVGAYAFASVQAWVMRQDVPLYERARAAVERGLAVGHGEAFLASAQLRFNQRDDERAARDLGTALVRTPMSAQAHELAGRISIEVDTSSEARHHLETAIGLDPGRAVIVAADLARLDGLDNRWHDADARVAPLLADQDPAIVQLGTVTRTRLACWRRRRDEVIEQAGKFAPRLGATTGAVFNVVATIATSNVIDHGVWREYAALPYDPQLPTRPRVLRFQLIAEIAAMVEDDIVAFEALEHAVDGGLIDLTWLDRCPLFAQLAAQPRFIAARRTVAERASRVVTALRSVTTSTQLH